jgi:uncharacterized protein YecE (DUF72 family)
MQPPAPRIGTSSFTADGWEKTFYPAGLPDTGRLSFYAGQFDTLEVDSTFYACPSYKTVRGWHSRTPQNFLFALKTPQVVTHEKCLIDCEREMRAFVEVAREGLEEKLGSLLLQFPYFNKKKFAKADDFIDRLEVFLADILSKLQSEKIRIRFAIELRNKAWITPRLLELLREHGIALALIDHPWMPPAKDLADKSGWVTADFLYVRLLGDRYAIEEKTKVWDKVIVDRSRELADWENALTRVRKRGEDLFIYINNHYSGHAPETVRAMRKYWERKAAAMG